MDSQINITPTKTIPDLERLLMAVEQRSPLRRSYVHGDMHWRAVAEVGLRLLDATPRADRMVVFLFALFHDAKRANEAADPGHGRRAATLARELHRRYFLLDDDALQLLLDACHGHIDELYSDDPTLGVCFDADRLNLWRVGLTPDPKYLSTDAALDDELQRWTSSLHGRARGWDHLFEAYSSLARARA